MPGAGCRSAVDPYPSGEDRGSGWLDSPWPAPSPCDVLDGAVDLGGVDRVRDEAVAGPLGHLGMALVLRIGERLQELLIAKEDRRRPRAGSGRQPSGAADRW